MSNHLAIAAATRTIAQMLDEQLTQDFAGAHVVAGRPDGPVNDDGDPEVRLFLYRVEPNSSWRTAALPGRSSTGVLYERPQVAVTLHYLLTFIGNEARLEPQRMLGSIVRALNARPLLARAEIEAMVAAALAEDPNHPLGLSDLAEQPEVVRLSPLPLTLDELSNLWSTFFQAPFRLSVAYEASVVILTTDESPTRALPVRERRLFIPTMLRPVIRSVRATSGPHDPILPGTPIEVLGNQLKADEITVIAFGGIEVIPGPEAITAPRIEVVVPANVRAGISGLRVLHRRLMGEPPEARLGGQSTAFAVVIQPRLLPLAAEAVHDLEIDADTGLRSGAITVSVEPPVGDRQQVTLMLNAVPGGSGHSYVFEDERRNHEGDPETTSALDLPFRGVAAGSYLIRVTVDGAESPLEADTLAGSPTEGQYTGPLVDIP